MTYAGFWIRAWAVFIDGMLFGIPTALLTDELYPGNSLAQAIGVGVEYTLFSLYFLYFLAKGQTLGKAIARIRVVSQDGTPPGFKRSFLRNMPGFCMNLAWGYVLIHAFLGIPPSLYAGLSHHDRRHVLEQYRPDEAQLIQWLMAVWSGADMISLLLSKKKRSLHDLIAGTVVIHTRSRTATEQQNAKPATPQPPAAGGSAPEVAEHQLP